MKRILAIFLVLQFSLLHSQEIIFEENFDNNNNNWVLKNEWNRKSTISNGILTDYFSGDGYQTTNLIPTNFDKSTDHCITIKIANFNNQDGYHYYTYKKKSNGSVVKADKVNHPSFSITLGYKDWDNYHALQFYTYENSYGRRELRHKFYSVTNGQTIIHNDWSGHNTISMDKNTGFNTISIKKSGDKYRIYNGEYSYSAYYLNDYLGSISLSNWYDSYLGFIIPAGTKIGVDYIKVTKESKKELSSSFTMPYTDIRTMVEKISEQQDSVNIWIKTSSDGKRKIHIEDSRVSGLQNDEYFYCLDYSKLIFKYMFEWVNYSLENPISYIDLTHAMKSKSIIGFDFKTESRLHDFDLEKVSSN